MPGTQPHGMHTFDPSSSSSLSATQIIDAINAEKDGEEDQLDPLHSPMDNMLAAQATTLLPFVNPDLGNSSSGQTSIVSSFVPSNPSASSSGARLPPSSSLPPSVHPQATPDASMGSVESISDVGQKCKHDVKSISGRQPSTSDVSVGHYARANKNKQMWSGLYVQ